MEYNKLYEHAKEQEKNVQKVLFEISKCMQNLDSVKPDGTCTSYYIDYDEQDIMHALVIFYSVISNYAIKHGTLTCDNVQKNTAKFKQTIKEVFGFDIENEMSISQWIQDIRSSWKGDK